MEFALLHLCALLVFWCYFLPILAEALGAALGAFFAELLSVLGRCCASVVVLAWGICCIVVVARRAARRAH